MKKTEIKNFPFKIGADPEFNIIFNDQRISAIKLIQKLYKKKKFIETEEGYKIKSAGEIGWDGAEATGELRPSPSENPTKVIKNLKQLIQSFIDQTKLFELSTLSEKAAIGGHIHFQLKKEQISNTIMNRIHKKLTSFMIPLMLGENVINTKIRMQDAYGKITDYKINKLKESITTYECRVPSAEWLTTPKIAKSTIAYLATVYNEIINHPKRFNKCKDIIYKTDKQGIALQNLAVTHFETIMKGMINKIKKYIKTFEFYPQYQEQIKYILNPNKVLSDKRKVNFDIIQGWNIEAMKGPTKRDLLNNKKVTKGSIEKNLDELTEIIKVPYNEDTNVQTFAYALKQRIIALNWKLKHNYYLWGLKKGIKDYIAMNKNNEFITGTKQIKTKSDMSTILETLERMKDKFSQSTNSNGLSTKEKTKLKQKNIILGIPYDIRIKGNTKTLIEVIYNIEKEKTIPIKLTEIHKKLRNDYSLQKNNPKKGKIFKLYNIESENIEDMTADSSYRRRQMEQSTNRPRPMRTEPEDTWGKQDYYEEAIIRMERQLKKQLER